MAEAVDCTTRSKKEDDRQPSNTEQNAQTTQLENDSGGDKVVVNLYQSSRLKGYITLAFASFINYDAAVQSDSTAGSGFIPSTTRQRRYAMSASMISLILSVSIILIHLDRLTPFRKIWVKAFQSGSRIELLFGIFFVIWWSITVGFQTSVTGIAGDGKRQYSLYYSAWACCSSSYWVLERWGVAAGWSSLKHFISSWPNRAPAWIVIMFLSFFSLIWYSDLRNNYSDLTRPDESFNYTYFANIPTGQWQLLMIVTSFTFIPATIFVLIELFRDSNADGTIQSKSKVENVIEGVCFLAITLMWIPTVMIATPPGGAASLIGNAYFFTWMLVVFVFEGVVWYIHDIRNEQHQELLKKEAEYRSHQRKILDETNVIIQNQRRQQTTNSSHDTDDLHSVITEF